MKSRLFYVLAACLIGTGALALTVTSKVTRTIDYQNIKLDSGYGYYASLVAIGAPFRPRGDNSEKPVQSDLVLTEDGRNLGPAHSLHEDIRKLGRGRYSHWGDSLLLSASDNGNPGSGTRTYAVSWDVHIPVWVGCLLIVAGLASLLYANPAPYFALRSAAGSNWHALRCLAAVIWRPAIIFVALAVAVFGFQETLSISARNEMLETTVDRIIVRQQYNRSAIAGWNPDILFVGDSSCLMGIDFVALQAELRADVKSVCTLAYVGPRGWGQFLAKQVASSGALQGRVVIVIHPVEFGRAPDWDGDWEAYVAGLDAEKPVTSSAADRVIMATQNKLLAKAIFRPMPGLMGTYYGNPAEFAQQVNATGGAINPTTGLNRARYQALSTSSITDPSARTVKTPNQKGQFTFSPNQLFVDTLVRLNASIANLELDRGNLLIAITPVPQSLVDMEFRQNRENALRIIARELSLDPQQIIELPLAMPDVEFSTTTHLNRYGRKHYTRILAKALSDNDGAR